jgi:hypothetical protein
MIYRNNEKKRFNCFEQSAAAFYDIELILLMESMMVWSSLATDKR